MCGNSRLFTVIVISFPTQYHQHNVFEPKSFIAINNHFISVIMMRGYCAKFIYKYVFFPKIHKLLYLNLTLHLFFEVYVMSALPIF